MANKIVTLYFFNDEKFFNYKIKIISFHVRSNLKQIDPSLNQI